MRNKRLLTVFIVGLLSLIIFPSMVLASSLNSLDVSENNNKITVSGEVKNDTLAVAVVVYQNNNLNYMETCSVKDNKTYSCELNHVFSKGTYTVKTADYDGGDYLSKEITILKSSIIDKDENPKTVDNISIYIVLGILFALCLLVIIFKLKLKSTINL